MNREIEFRGQDFFTGKWVFGSLHKNEVGDLFILTDHGDFRVKPETVGQFTTHKDCKDNKMLSEMGSDKIIKLSKYPN